MEKLRVGVIGCGRISDLHLNGYIDNPHAEVAAVCDIDSQLAESTAKRYGVERSETDYRRICDDPGIDAVEILTPQLLHEEMSLYALERGKHVSLQKPMTITLEGADRLVDAAGKSKKIFRVADNYLFYSPVVLAKKMIEAGEIGEPTNIRIKMISGASGGWAVPETAWEWRRRETKDGRGMQTFDHGHHLWAVAWFLFGPVEKVVSWVDSIDGIIDSPAVMMWKHRDGLRYGSCEYAHAAELEIPSRYYSNDEFFEITGTKGMIMLNKCTGSLMDRAPVSIFTQKGWRHVTDIETDWADGFLGSTRNFIRSIRNEEAPLLSAEQGREILKFDLALAASARMGREILLDEMEKEGVYENSGNK